MEFDTPGKDIEPDAPAERHRARGRFLRAVGYFVCAVIVFAALLVAVVSASVPPPDEAKIVVTDEVGSRTVSRDTVKALRQACAGERIETPTWHWSPLRLSENELRCIVRNRDTNQPSTLIWGFQDFGRDAAGAPLVLLSSITINGNQQGAYTATYLLVAVLHAMPR